MSATITTSVVTGGTNSHASTVSDINAFRTDFASPGCAGTLTNTSGVAPSTGAFAVNAQGSPAMFVDITAGSCYITATPSGQVSQLLRANMTATYTSYAISANSSGSTKYDWIYLSVDATKANNPASDASDVTSLVTSRSSSNTADNGSPPTYGQLLAVVTVANGASSIANASIADKRTRAALQTAAQYGFIYDFIESGCVWTADSAGATLAASMTSGFVWLSGVRLSVAAVSARAFTASKDTYVDFSNNGDGTAALTYTTATNNAASVALTAGFLRNAIIVSGASSIAAAASINQGQETIVLPIASSIPYTVTDSLGNLICPRDPNRRIIGYKQATSTFTLSASQTTPTQITGLSCPVIVPTGRKVKVTIFANSTLNATSNASSGLQVWDGVVNSGSKLTESSSTNFAANGLNNPFAVAIATPASASKTYNAGAVSGSATNVQVTAASNAPAYIMVELV